MKEQESEIEKLNAQNKEQKSQNKEQDCELLKIEVRNKKLEITIARMELSNLEREGEMKKKIEMMELQHEAQKEKIAQRKQPSREIRRIE